MNAPPPFQDDKAPIVVPFIIKHLRAHQQAQHAQHPHNQPPRPLFVGLNGLQGIGKTSLVALLTAALRDQGVSALVCSIDDFYLMHEDQVALAARHPDNALWQHRGEPGTHDIPLAKEVLASLLNNSPTLIPQYDKAAFSGQGDRLPRSLWLPVNQHHQPGQDQALSPLAPQVIILEGWCIGFRPLSPPLLSTRYALPSRTLRAHPLPHLHLINDHLAAYDPITDLFDAFIHIDAQELDFVYRWRAEQEDHLRRTRGGDAAVGMSEEQVRRFVDGYFPAYELYVEGLREGVLRDPGRKGAQLRIVVDCERKVTQVCEI